MMDKLEKLRAKPDHIKRMVSVGVAGGITLVIVLFWIVSLSVSTGPSAQADAASAYIAASPFTSLTASVADAFAPVGAAFSNLIDSFSGKQQVSSNAIQLYPSTASATAAEMNTVGQSENQ